MPSPLCQVKDGAGAYLATTNGNDVTAGNVITIDLVDKAVNSWAITCLTTDELSVAATPNAALAASINSVTKRATFVAPVAGRTYRFQSIVEGGKDANGRPRPSYTTTFCVYVPTGGRRVVAADEQTEGSPAFGWIASFNSLVRNPNAQPDAAAGAKGLIQLAGDLAGLGGTAALPRVSGITGNASGYAQNSAINGTQLTGNPKRPATEFNVNIVTATTAATAIFSFATTTNRKYLVRASVESMNSPGSAYSTWSIKATAINNAGVLTIVTAGGGVTNEDNVGGFSLTFTVVGTSLVVTATDPLSGRRWTGTVYIAESAF